MSLKKPSFVPASLQRRHEEALRERIISIAEGYLGTPYVLGGKSKDPGIDCSGLVTTVLLAALDDQRFKPLVQNVALLRTSPILETVDSPQRGDLVLWDGHAGFVYNPTLGDFLGAQTSTGVAIASYTTGYWSSQPGRIFRRFGSYFVHWSRHFLGA